MTHGVTKVNGVSYNYQGLTGSLNYFTLRTLVNITVDPTAVADVYGTPTGANPTAGTQLALDQLVEIISTRAQPIILGQVATTTETSPADLPAASGSVTVYTLRFAIEHNMAWDVNSLMESLDGINAFVYTTPTTHNNVSIVEFTDL